MPCALHSKNRAGQPWDKPGHDGGENLSRNFSMKLTFSPASPFARKVRIAAIEAGLIDKIEFVPATVAPGQANEEYARITALKKLPVLSSTIAAVTLVSYVMA